jgi:hypothetical protein
MTEKLRALALAAKPTRPANSQEWAGMDASTAFLLINRHADGWADIDLMMNEWRLANPPESRALLDEIDRLKAENAGLLGALGNLIGVITDAGLFNLSNGVQLGQTVWYVKASDAMDSARAAIASARKQGDSHE